MKTLRMTDDTNLTIPTVKMVCECGWVEKANADRDARQRAENHMRTAHTHGVIYYNGHALEV